MRVNHPVSSSLPALHMQCFPSKVWSHASYRNTEQITPNRPGADDSQHIRHRYDKHTSPSTSSTVGPSPTPITCNPIAKAWRKLFKMCYPSEPHPHPVHEATPASPRTTAVHEENTTSTQLESAQHYLNPKTHAVMVIHCCQCRFMNNADLGHIMCQNTRCGHRICGACPWVVY